MDSRTSKETVNHCALCCEQVQIFALGKCDHPVCYKCSTKMRVLCEQRDCAFCKEELDKVVFVEKLEAFSCLPYQQFHCEKKHDIYISNKNIYLQYRRLLALECLHCSEPRVFSKFEELQEHMMRQHKLFCCKLCTTHLKIFSREQKWYGFKQLACHYAYGDPGDPSHRGHPLCKICRNRYFDKNQLLNHLQKDHFCCPFCDVNHTLEYYSDNQSLRQHFRESHYLCEENHCATQQFTNAFRFEIDYKAHKIAAHSKSWAEARRNHQLDLHFNYTSRDQGRNEGLKSSFPMKSSIRPPSPPGLGMPATTKPPPGFTETPLSSNLAGPASASVVNLCPEMSSNVHMVPDEFKKRSLALIMSILKYLDNDKSNLNEFKHYSAQFCQDVISAAQYHRSCKDLLGENFNNIFNELLVLLPDGKQGELLAAHKNSRAVEKQSVAGGTRENKYKNACQTPTNVAHDAAEWDHQVCPTCKQTLGVIDLTRQDMT